MKKIIIILTGGIIVISLLWLVDERFLTKTSDPESTETQRKEESCTTRFGNRSKGKS